MTSKFKPQRLALISSDDERAQIAAGKLSFDSIIAQQNQPVDVASPANDLLRFLKK